MIRRVGMLVVLAVPLVGLAVAGPDRAHSQEEGWIKLFNGKDLTGWKSFLDPKKQGRPGEDLDRQGRRHRLRGQRQRLPDHREGVRRLRPQACSGAGARRAGQGQPQQRRVRPRHRPGQDLAQGDRGPAHGRPRRRLLAGRTTSSSRSIPKRQDPKVAAPLLPHEGRRRESSSASGTSTRSPARATRSSWSINGQLVNEGDGRRADQGQDPAAVGRGGDPLPQHRAEAAQVSRAERQAGVPGRTGGRHTPASFNPGHVRDGVLTCRSSRRAFRPPSQGLRRP